MGKITLDMKAVITSAKLSFVATVNADGTPNLSPKATLAVYDDDRLIFANIASPGTIDNLSRNPAVEINVVDVFLRRGYRFKGRAKIVAEGVEFDHVAQALRQKRGPDYPVHHAVLIDVVEAAALLSPAYMFGGAEETEVKAAWIEEYGLALNAAAE